MSDGDIVLQTSIREWHDLVKTGFFQVIGYSALKIAEIVSRSRGLGNGALPETTQQQLAVRKEEQEVHESFSYLVFPMITKYVLGTDV